MSLGLGDLKKRKQPRPAQFVASKTARSWTESDAVRSPTKPRRRANVNATMNEDWVDLHAEPLFWIDLNSDSRWTALMEKLSLLEERIQERICAPIRFVQTLLAPQHEKL